MPLFRQTPPTTGVIGADAEELACRFLLQQGLKLIERNFQVAQGEVDLIMRDQDILAFIEVRFRKHTQFGSGADTVTRSKQAKLIKTALRYLQAHPKLAKLPARFDVISISAGAEPDIEWIKDAFQA